MVQLPQSKKPPASPSLQARLTSINFLWTSDFQKVELVSPELKKRGMESKEKKEEEESEQKRRRGKREKVFLCSTFNFGIKLIKI